VVLMVIQMMVVETVVEVLMASTRRALTAICDGNPQEEVMANRLQWRRQEEEAL